jgi:hypothetical protein
VQNAGPVVFQRLVVGPAAQPVVVDGGDPGEMLALVEKGIELVIGQLRHPRMLSDGPTGRVRFGRSSAVPTHGLG